MPEFLCCQTSSDLGSILDTIFIPKTLVGTILKIKFATAAWQGLPTPTRLHYIAQFMQSKYYLALYRMRGPKIELYSSGHFPDEHKLLASATEFQ